MKKIWQQALLNSTLTTLYVVLIGLFMYYASMIKLGKANAFLAPITLLLLFVFSAGLTGFLVLGKPALIYIDGKKKEAISLLMYTFGFLLMYTVISLGLLFIFSAK